MTKPAENDRAEPVPETRDTLLVADNLHVDFASETGRVRAVNGVSFQLARGETLAILGESGSGKSVLAQALMGIVPPPGRVSEGTVRFEGLSLDRLSKRALRRIRGSRISLIFQDALVSLNPRFTIEQQIAEVLREHTGMSWREASLRVDELLAKMGIPEPGRRKKAYPHQFSGGMRQRVLIAMALCLDPELVIADEPTTALDVTVQAQILDLLAARKAEAGMGLIFITHDLGVARQIADTILVMYAGEIVEMGRARDVLNAPAHPYTLGLLRSTPKRANRKERLEPIPGAPPDLRNIPSGCPFHPRCAMAQDICTTTRPPREHLERGRISACHFAREVGP